MHTALFLEPGHFHAALTLRQPHPRLADEIAVYAREGQELTDFLALVDRFNRRPDQPTRWRPAVMRGGDPLDRLLAERRGDVVVLAGRTQGKVETIHRLHDAGFHVLADKPWLVHPDDLAHVRASVGDWPLAMEIMTGRRDVAANVLKRLVDTPEVFGHFRLEEPALELESVHQLEKTVDGAPLRRPWWFFDVRVQGSGAVDIPTHLVDQAQWLVDGPEGAAVEAPRLRAARAWATPVPLGAFCRITREPAFPSALGPLVKAGALPYLCNAELEFRIGRVDVRAAARWELTPPPGAGDSARRIARGTRADITLEQGERAGHRRRLTVKPREEARGVARALSQAVAAWQGVWPGLSVKDAGGSCEVEIPAALDAGHESHFAQVLDEFLRLIDERRWPAAQARRTLDKYALLAEAADAVSRSG